MTGKRSAGIVNTPVTKIQDKECFLTLIQKRTMKNSDGLLVVPINSDGVADYEADTSKRHDLQEFVFPEAELAYLFNNGMADALNSELGICIDEREEEMIQNKYLEQALKAIEKHKNELPVLYQALSTAIEYDTE